LSEEDEVISSVADYLTYLTVYFIGELMGVLTDLNQTCSNKNKWVINSVLNDRNVITLGEPLTYENKFCNDSNFRGIFSTGLSVSDLLKKWEEEESYPTDQNKISLIRKFSALYRHIHHNCKYSQYVVTFTSTRSTDNLQKKSLSSILDEYFSLDKWTIDFNWCESTITYRSLLSNTEMNIMISGTYENRSVAILEIFGRENFLCITTNNHVF
jgi:hypothetical protein